MIPLLWLGASLLLVLGELAVGDLALLMLGGGALAASGASQLGAPLWLSVVIFAVVSAALVLTVRPMLRKKMAKPDKSAELESRPELLAGRHAEVIEPVSSSAGLIKVNGELWSARSLLSAQTFDTKERVTIVEISGNTAVVDKLL
ncbi:NfeD family protein [Corynebacterium vitaeruminis]|uniref:NfeD family protein n=1 Tax=Corynebacterium vitaeruminis TaxID=38305 RepID=UPI00080A9097|nr:NfeD family protein [Corynebacterium vitaeruminis]